MKKRNITYIVIGSIILVGCIWAFLASLVITAKFKNDIKSSKISQQKVAIEGMLLTETKDGEKLWELYADKAYYDSNTKIILLENIIGNFWQNKEVFASAKSSLGTYNTVNKKVILYNDSFIAYKDGMYLKSNLIEWTGKNQDITASKNVIIEKPNEYKIYAPKAIFTDNMTVFKVIGKVRTEIYRKGHTL